MGYRMSSVSLLGLTIGASFDDVAKAIILETRRRGYTRAESVACVSTGIQESGLRMVWSPNGLWFGYFQQDSSYPNRMDPYGNIVGFLDRLDKKRGSAGASPDPFKNIFWLQQRPGDPSAELAFQRGRQAYLAEIERHVAQAEQLHDRLVGGQPVEAQPMNRPDFNEYPIWSASNSGRDGATIDLFLLHTQEGNGNADSLARWLSSPTNEVSYHYTISEDYNDHGVTVCDVVDTDRCSWSALSANRRSINLCFAGSRASWSREEWLRQSRAIDVAAYLVAQDCMKYNIAPNVIPGPNYNADPPGISDHRYCTNYLKDGNTHTDVGDNFPWDVFEAALHKYAKPAAVRPAPGFQYPPTEEMIKQIWEQLFGFKARGWEDLFGKTANGSRGKFTVEAIADLYRRIDALTHDKNDANEDKSTKKPNSPKDKGRSSG